MQLLEGFVKFWRSYPRKVAKGAAYKAWIKNGCEPISDKIVKAVKSQTFSDDPQFIPFPSTWLNAWRWEDEIEPSADDQALEELMR